MFSFFDIRVPDLVPEQQNVRRRHVPKNFPTNSCDGHDKQRSEFFILLGYGVLGPFSLTS